MKVSELIEALKTMPQDKDIIYLHLWGYYDREELPVGVLEYEPENGRVILREDPWPSSAPETTSEIAEAINIMPELPNCRCSTAPVFAIKPCAVCGHENGEHKSYCSYHRFKT